MQDEKNAKPQRHAKKIINPNKTKQKKGVMSIQQVPEASGSTANLDLSKFTFTSGVN